MTSLLDLIPEPTEAPLSGSIRERFEIYNKANPQVLETLERLAERMVARGRQRIGIKMLFEVLRWDYYMQTTDPNSEFKINNNYAPYYARLIIERHPDWCNLFQLRQAGEE